MKYIQLYNFDVIDFTEYLAEGDDMFPNKLIFIEPVTSLDVDRFNFSTVQNEIELEQIALLFDDYLERGGTDEIGWLRETLRNAVYDPDIIRGLLSMIAKLEQYTPPSRLLRLTLKRLNAAPGHLTRY